MITKIVIEGPNNVGKTTFINTLKRMDEFKDWLVIHMTGDDDNSYAHYDALFSSNEKIIFDRAHVGEVIYPAYYNTKPDLTFDEMLKLSEKYSENVLYFFITADKENIIKMYVKKCETNIYDDDLVKYELETFEQCKNALLLQKCKVYTIITKIN